MHARAADGARAGVPRVVSLRCAAAAMVAVAASALAGEGLLIGLRLDRGKSASVYRSGGIVRGDGAV